MKNEWKPEELRQTSEEIRGAVLAKSITPEMVGGTLAGLTAALTEVVDVLGEIPREHVRVWVRATDGFGVLPSDGATVEIEIFSTGGFPCVQLAKLTQEVDAEGYVEFDVPHGFTYAVRSKLAGMGASFQLVNDANRNERLVTLWNMPIGIFAYGQAGIWTSGYYGPSYPYIRETFEDDVDLDWINADVESIYGEGEAGTDEYCWRGILVSTADTAFVIMPDNLSAESMQWSSSYGYGVEVPFCKNFNPDDMDVSDSSDPYTKAQNLAMEDYDGHSNSVKILRGCIKPTAAEWCAGMRADWYDQHNYLPSAGELYIMWLNREAINKLINDAVDNNYFDNFKLLPYKNDKGQWQNPNGGYEYWWSSTQAGPLCSWVVNYNGDVSNSDRNGTYDVRAVSAFHFEY